MIKNRVFGHSIFMARAWLVVALTACGGGHTTGDASAGDDVPVDGAPSPPVPGQVVVWIEEMGASVGTGRVVSFPAGLDCPTMFDPSGVPLPTRCSAMFAGQVTLTATPDPGYVFAGWNGSGCGTSPTCTVTTQFDQVTVFAYFLPAGYHVVSFTGGTAPSDVYALAMPSPHACDSANSCQSVTARCHAPCMVPVPDGWGLSIAGSTPSTFNGISGACTSAIPTCTFTPTGDATVSIDTSLDSHELLSRTLTIPYGDERVGITGVDVDSQDHIVFATRDSLRKIDATGAMIWARPLAGPARVRIDPDDHIILHTNTTLSRWTPDGTMEWSNAVAGASIAVSPNGDIAVDSLSAPGSLQVFDSSGTPRWSTPRDVDFALDFAPDGSLWVARYISNSLDGFAPDGTPLRTMLFVVPDDGSCVGLSTDANGFVSSSAGEFGLTSFRRYTWAGMAQFGDDPNDGGSPNDYDAPNTLASDGGIWWVYGAGTRDAGYRLRSYDANGVARFALARGSNLGLNAYMVAHDLRPLSQGRVVVVGYYEANRLETNTDDVLDGAFIQIFAP